LFYAASGGYLRGFCLLKDQVNLVATVNILLDFYWICIDKEISFVTVFLIVAEKWTALDSADLISVTNSFPKFRFSESFYLN
jgi:hypothetical protein